MPTELMREQGNKCGSAEQQMPWLLRDQHYRRAYQLRNGERLSAQDSLVTPANESKGRIPGAMCHMSTANEHTEIVSGLMH